MGRLIVTRQSMVCLRLCLRACPVAFGVFLQQGEIIWGRREMLLRREDVAWTGHVRGEG